MTANTMPSASHRGLRLLGRLLIAFIVAGLLAVVLAVAAVYAFVRSYDGRIVPGVQVGSVDLGGLTRDEAIAKLNTSYAYLGDGTINVKTPIGSDVITFKEAGRGPDGAAMADAALAIGRNGDAITDAVTMIRTATRGEQVPLMVKLDPQALAGRIRSLTSLNGLAPRDAKAISASDDFSVVPAVVGRGMDEPSLSAAIMSQLTSVSTPATIAAEGTYITVEPTITDQKAQAAVDAARRMSTDVKLVLAKENWTIPKTLVAGWVTFGLHADGTYGPSIDFSSVRPQVEALAPKITKAPVEPTLLTDRKSGKWIGVSGGSAGRELNIDATAQAVTDYLNALARDGQPGDVPVSVTSVEPKLSSEALSKGINKMERLGWWRVQYFPGESNGNGVNIEIPAKMINGSVVAPGQIGSFWKLVGPVDYAHGYRDGGVIRDGKSYHTGAIAGGICSASTTLFNAVMRSGLEIIERHQHDYYIDRYPRGLDATVYKSGDRIGADMRFRNDTAYPIVIRGWTTKNHWIYFEVWGVPDGRKVTIYQAPKTDVIKAVNRTVYVTTRRAGTSYWAEYRTDGFKTYATRVVKDASGRVIHSDLWKSSYIKVDGRLEIGVGAGGTPKPGTPKPTTKPATPKPSTPPPAGGFIVLVPFARRRALDSYPMVRALRSLRKSS